MHMFKLWKILGEKEEKEKKECILTPAEGTVVALSEVNDPAFSQEILGKGVAIIPARGRIVAPVDGIVKLVFETKHAVSIISDGGAEIIIHVGLDTVKLKGQNYTSYKKEGERVKAGDLLLEFNMEAIQKAGYDLITPIIILNSSAYPDMVCHIGKTGKELEPMIELQGTK